ncbi:MAG TPA: VWA domain-containing protein [Blastocatellia bacterium]|nr:VWA domain-containing protein [Blastocatellia bacterium]
MSSLHSCETNDVRPRKRIFFRLLAAVLAAGASLSAPIYSPELFAGRTDANTAQESRPRRAIEQQRPADQQQEKPLRIGADLVTVLTSVSDAGGNRIYGLNRSDFEIYEDNVPQDVEGVYTEEQVPLRLVFLFDLSLSVRQRFDFEQRAAARFFRQVMRTGDQAAIISVSTEPRVEVQFTPSVDRLVEALGRMIPGGATALYSATIEAAKYLRPAEGRHVIIVLSDGNDIGSSSTLTQTLAEVHKSDAVIYCVHSTGIAPSANVRDLGGEFVLKAMSEETGGYPFFPPIYREIEKETRDLDEIYRRITADVRAQYVLTYYSKSNANDGRFRLIRVAVKRPGLQVRARRGYYASAVQ